MSSMSTICWVSTVVFSRARVLTRAFCCNKSHTLNKEWWLWVMNLIGRSSISVLYVYISSFLLLRLLSPSPLSFFLVSLLALLCKYWRNSLTVRKDAHCNKYTKCRMTSSVSTFWHHLIEYNGVSHVPTKKQFGLEYYNFKRIIIFCLAWDIPYAIRTEPTNFEIEWQTRCHQTQHLPISFCAKFVVCSSSSTQKPHSHKRADK